MRVFPDTGVLLAMVVFPRDRSGGFSLAGEVLQLYEAGAFDLTIGQAAVDELDEVLDVRTGHILHNQVYRAHPAQCQRKAAI